METTRAVRDARAKALLASLRRCDEELPRHIESLALGVHGIGVCAATSAAAPSNAMPAQLNSRRLCRKPRRGTAFIT